MKNRKIMSNGTGLKTQVQDWVVEEGITVSQIPDDTVEFRLRAAFGGYFIDIVKEKNMKRVVCVANLAFHEKVIQGYGKLTTKKAKSEFRYDLQIELVKLRPGINIQPAEIDTLSSIIIDDATYLDELGKPSIMRSIQYVAKSLHIANILTVKRFEVDFTTPNASSVSPGVT